MGNFPCERKTKKPKVIRDGDEKQLIYGRGDHLDITPAFVSSDFIYFGDYTVPPGEYFEPPDIHEGDECYYCLEGEAAICNPETGQTLVIKKGDGLLIPKGTWHQGFNFGNESFRLLAFIAPAGWSAEGESMGLEIEYKGKRNYLTLK